MKKDLPIFDIILNDEDLKQGVGRISLVDEPAIGVDWIALRKQPKSILAKRKCEECLAEDGPCWEGYEQVGMKVVDGKEVPNCVPVKDGKPEPSQKLNKIMAKRECLACPPNGDGTRVNGEPDRRCKEGSGGAGKGAGTVAKGLPKVGGKTAESTKSKVEVTPPLSIPISVQSLAPAAGWNNETVAYWSDPANVEAVDKKNEEIANREKDIVDRANAFNKELEKYPKLRNGNYDIPASERGRLLDLQRGINIDKNNLDREKQDMFRINSVLKTVKDAGGPSALKTIEQTKAAAREEASKVTKNEQKAAKSAQKRIDDPTFDKPPTARDYAQAEVAKRAEAYQKALEDFHNGKMDAGRLQSIKNGYEASKKYVSPTFIKKANDDYNSLIDNEKAKLPKVYDRNRDEVRPGYIRQDDTWDYNKGEPKSAPRGKKRELVYEQRSFEDIMNGYDAYKIEVRWE